MDDLVSKAAQLASLVNTLPPGESEDNSDISGIIAQLEAAVAKRRISANATLDDQTPLIEAKIEPVEPGGKFLSNVS